MGAKLPDLATLYQAGIDPKTGLPLKFSNGCKSMLKENLRMRLRIQDEQDAVNRYVWYNLPANITSQELERLLYLKGQLCFFYDKNLEEFYFMPYALDGQIDLYQRFVTVHPVPMTAGVDDKTNKAQAEYLSTLKLKCVYGVKTEIELKDLTDSTVLLHDYTKQLSQTIVPRATLQEPLLDVMAECIPFMRTSMIASTGIKGVRVNDADQQQNVYDGSRSLENAALTGNIWVPIIGNIEFQELTNQTQKIEDYMLALQSLDNFRLAGYGIDNGGLFEKKAHELQTEADLNGGPVGLVLQDGLSIRQNFCNIANSIWGLGIWCEPAENIIGADINGDGLVYDRNEGGENSGIENDNNVGGEDNE